MNPVRTLVLYANTADNSTFSYQRAWPRHLARHSQFTCTNVNVADRSWTSRTQLEWHCRRFSGDLIVVLHSVFSNGLMLPERLVDVVANQRQPKVYFIGNEYKLMPEKMAFCERINLSLLVSQSLSPDVHALYKRRLRCAVTGIPNTGLDLDLFVPTSDPGTRPIDLGYRAADAPFYLGHRERREIAEFFTARAAAYGLHVDISLCAKDRFDERGWAAFLNRCKGQLGSEAGGDYFDLEDATRHRVEGHLARHPDATFEAVRARFFPPPHEHVPLRIMSGRQVEAAGTKTVQILFEGRYDDVLRPDVHYIPLKKDFSDADQAIRKFRDVDFRTRVAEHAYDLVREQFTYDRLIDRLYAAVQPLM